MEDFICFAWDKKGNYKANDASGIMYTQVHKYTGAKWASKIGGIVCAKRAKKRVY
jgi:uncharacterized protein (DUF927 family)